MSLTEAQLAALDHITTYANSRKEAALENLQHVLAMSNISQASCEAAIHKIKTYARIALHFHPDRPDANMQPIAQALLEQGIYKSQFETLLSNGSVTAYPGGRRDLWEKRLFGGAYQMEGVRNADRPKYGALDLMHHPDGASPRFGSCYFLLKPAVSHRSTFTYLDSYQDPKEKGTFAAFEDVFAALMEDAFVNDFAIGEKELTPPKLVQHLLTQLDKPYLNPSTQAARRNLNHYIEAQIHGEISLEADVEMLVADPSFKSTYIGDLLEKICRTFSIDLYWHMGFALTIDEVPSDFRGPKMPSLAKRIASNTYVDTASIGVAAMDLKENPSAWTDRGNYKEVLQELKLLWHVLVRYGKPLSRFKA